MSRIRKFHCWRQSKNSERPCIKGISLLTFNASRSICIEYIIEDVKEEAGVLGDEFASFARVICGPFAITPLEWLAFKVSGYLHASMTWRRSGFCLCNTHRDGCCDRDGDSEND